jgi:hypothetical protein
VHQTRCGGWKCFSGRLKDRKKLKLFNIGKIIILEIVVPRQWAGKFKNVLRTAS